MSFFNLFYDHPLVAGCSLLLVGFGSGFAVNQYFSDHFNRVEIVAKESLSNDVLDLQQQVLSKDQIIQSLSSDLSLAQDELLNRRNKTGSDGVSIQILNEKYNSLSQNYNQLSGMYDAVQSNYRKAQQNCNALNRIGFLEQKGRSLENQLKSVSYDVFEKDAPGRKQEIELQMRQNHEQLMSLQQQLFR